MVAQTVKNLPAMQETRVLSLGQEDPLEKGMATHSSILAWRIPWSEEPGGLHSQWGHKESDTAERLNTCTHFDVQTTCPLLHNFYISWYLPLLLLRAVLSGLLKMLPSGVEVLKIPTD